MKSKIVIVAAVALVLITVGAYMGLTASATGTLVVKLTDPPVEWGPADNVYIRYSAIAIHNANATEATGWYNVTNVDRWIDLGETLDMNMTIGSVALKPGIYNQIRFEVIEAKVMINGVNFTAPVESGVLKIVIPKGGVEVKAGQATGVLIDITPKVIEQHNGYKVVPAAKASPTKATG
jgi:hypothetical protein